MNYKVNYKSEGKDIFRKKEKIYINRALEQIDPHLHTHDFIEIAYVARGKGSHRIGNREYDVSRGDLFLINYNIPHEFRSLPGQPELVVYNCVFLPEFLDNSLVNCHDFGEITQHFLFRSLFPEEIENRADIKLLDRESKDIERLYEKMYREYQLQDRGYINLLRAYLIELLVKIFRLWQNDEKKIDQVEFQRRQLIDRAISYMEEHYSGNIKLDELATVALLSPGYFSTLFKKYTGMNVSEYIQKLRIEEACRLLQETQKKVIDIAGEIGYRDVKYFNKIFKRITGSTPSEYRN